MNKKNNLGFTFQQTGTEYQIFHNGKKATTLRGHKAADFAFDISEMDFSEQQQLMARLTGNYKHGNERTAQSHPRNRKYWANSCKGPASFPKPVAFVHQEQPQIFGYTPAFHDWLYPEIVPAFTITR